MFVLCTLIAGEWTNRRAAFVVCHTFDDREYEGAKMVFGASGKQRFQCVYTIRDVLFRDHARKDGSHEDSSTAGPPDAGRESSLCSW